MQKRFRILLFLCLCLSALVALPSSVPEAYAFSNTFYTGAPDGGLYHGYPYWEECWNAETASSYSQMDENLGIGTAKISGYFIYRSVVPFDTSSLPDNAVITYAELQMVIFYDNAVEDTYIVIQNGTGEYPHDPLIAEDYFRGHYHGMGGNLSTVGIELETQYNISLTAEGISWINLKGNTRFVLRSSGDIDGIEPTAGSSIFAYAYEGDPNKQMKLYVEYLLAPIAAYSWTPYTPLPKEVVQFNASASYDSDGEITNYYWDFGDGYTDTGLAPTHSYPGSATYVVNLTITDDDNLNTSLTKNIMVVQPPYPYVPPFVYPRAKKAYILHVHVLDLFNLDASDLDIIIKSSTGEVVATSKTKTDGTTPAIPLKEGSYIIEIYQDDRFQLSQTVLLEEDTTLTIQIGIPVAITFTQLGIVALIVLGVLLYLIKRRKHEDAGNRQFHRA